MKNLPELGRTIIRPVHSNHEAQGNLVIKQKIAASKIKQKLAKRQSSG